MKTWAILVSNARISEFRPRSGRLAFRRVSAGPPDPGDRASIPGKDSMSFLNNVDSKVIVAGLGTLAVFGSFVVAVIIYAILQGVGLNDDLSWAMAMLVWIAVVAVSAVAVVSFYKNLSNNRVEQVTVIREVIAPAPTVPQIVASGPELTPFPGQPASAAPSSGFPSMPPKDKSLEPESPPFVDEPQPATTPSVSFRDLLVEENKAVEPEAAPTVDEPEGEPSPNEPEPIDTPSVNYRSLLAEGDKAEGDKKGG